MTYGMKFLMPYIDRLSHLSTTEEDIINTVAAMRRKCHGKLASSMIYEIQDEDDGLAEKLRAIIDNQAEEIREMRKNNATLAANNEKLKQQASHPIDDPIPKFPNSMTHEDVLRLMLHRFRKVKGVGIAWERFSKTLHEKDPTSPLVTTVMQQKWRIRGDYPDWSIDQLKMMPEFTEKSNHSWRTNEIDFLNEVYHKLRPLKGLYEKLAEECSKKFGVEIPVNGIRTQIRRLRQLGRIDPV